MANVDGDEWEYEYDESETEDFYITLDLSNVPNKASDQSLDGSIRPSLSRNPTLLQNRLRALHNAVRRTGDNVDTSNSEGPTTNGQMQVVGLHTENPLIMYDGQLLSCKWMSSIGTDMFFVKPGPDPGSPEQPLRSLPSVDLLAISSTKLIASVAQLRPRDELFENASHNKESTTDKMDISEGAEPKLQEEQQSVDEDSPPAIAETRVAPTGFLARLNQAKAKRGEKTRLMVSKGSSGSHIVASTDEAIGESLRETEDVVMGGTDEQAQLADTALRSG